MLCFRLFNETNPDVSLADAVAKLREGPAPTDFYAVEPASFQQIPRAPFAYWVSERVRQFFPRLESFESEERFVRVGDHPGDGFRYTRLAWEVLHESDNNWVPYQKGGAYSKFYHDVHLCVNWDPSQKTYKGFQGRKGRSSIHPSNYEFFFRPGITWPRRSQKGLSFRLMSKGCVFADKGPAIFLEGDDPIKLLELVALVSSSFFSSMVYMHASFGSYEVGIIQIALYPERMDSRLCDLALSTWSGKQKIDTATLTSHAFHAPALAPGRKPAAR